MIKNKDLCFVLPENITNLTELAGDYAKELKMIIDPGSFQRFLDKWDYWLDDDTKSLRGEDWAEFKPVLNECRGKGLKPEEKHKTALAFLVPEKLLIVAIEANHFKVPWGLVYLRMREEKVIDF